MKGVNVEPTFYVPLSSTLSSAIKIGGGNFRGRQGWNSKNYFIVAYRKEKLIKSRCQKKSKIEACKVSNHWHSIANSFAYKPFFPFQVNYIEDT